MAAPFPSTRLTRAGAKNLILTSTRRAERVNVMHGPPKGPISSQEDAAARSLEAGKGQGRRSLGQVLSPVARGSPCGFLVSMPSWWQAPLSHESPDLFIIKIVNLGGERESLFLGGFLIFVWSAPHGLAVVGIHDNHDPPRIVLITCGVPFHVGVRSD